MNCVCHPYIPRTNTKPCSISSDRRRIDSAFLACSLYLAGVLAGWTNSTLLMPPLNERGETKVVQPFIGIDRVHIWARKAVEAPQKIKILPHWRRELGFDRTQPSSTGVKLSIYWRLFGTVTVDRHYIRPLSPLAQVLLSWILWQLLADYHCLCAMELPFPGENWPGNKALTPQGCTVSTCVLSHKSTWEQALAPHSKSVLYTVVRALEIKRQQLLYIHPEGQLKRWLSRYSLWQILLHWKIRWSLKARKIWNQVPLWARSST